MSNGTDNEDPAPFILNLAAFQRVYQEVEETDDEGVVHVLKLQSTQAFRDKFNELTYEMLVDCINHARSEGRKTLWPEDVPRIQGD